MKALVLALFFLITMIPLHGQTENAEGIDHGVIDLRTQTEDYTISEGGKYQFTTNGELWEYSIIAKTEDKLTIVLENVNIKSYASLNFNQAKDVTIIIKGDNILDSRNQDGYFATIFAPGSEDSQLIIEGTDEDKLTIYACDDGAGIGWSNSASSKIIINGGNLIINNKYGAGIGSSYEADFGDIIINGGIINISSSYSACIGGSYDKGETLPEIIIKNDVSVTIHGGTIIAHNYSYLPAMGFVILKEDSKDIFQTDIDGKPGNAFIIANGLAFVSNSKSLSAEDMKNYNCILFCKLEANVFEYDTKTGYIFGKPILSTDAEIPEESTLYINNEDILTIAEGTSLTNSGTINIENGGSCVNNGTLLINGSLSNKGTITNNGNIIVYNNKEDIPGITLYDITFNPNGENVENIPDKIAATSDSKIPVIINTPPTRENYTFIGWNTIPDAKEAIYTENEFNISISQESLTLYAIWKYNKFKVDNSKIIERTYGDDSYKFDISTLIGGIDDKTDYLPVTSYEIQSSPIDGISLQDNFLEIDCSLPSKENAYDIIIKCSNGIETSDQLMTIQLKILSRELTINIPDIKVLYTDEIETYKKNILFKGAMENEIPAYDQNKFIVKENKLSFDDFILIDNGKFIATNYQLKIPENKDIKIINEDASEQVASITEGIRGQNGWYISDIKISSPEGFTIEGQKSDLKNTSVSQQTELIISEEGKYNYEYTIKNFTQSKTESFSVLLDKSAPEAVLTSKDYSSATFTLTDNVSGIASYSYILDGGILTEVKELDTTDPVIFKLACSSGSHTLLLNVTDISGNMMEEKSFSFTIEKEPYNPPTPPSPVYYTVSLPEIEGITFDKPIGDYDVESYDNFSFSFILNEGYREQSHPVVKANGEIITPRVSDGKYILKYVDTDIVITVEGILKDVPTANMEISKNIHIYCMNRVIYIEIPYSMQCCLLDYSGRIACKKQLISGMNRIEGIAAGIYILQLEGQPGIKILCK